MRAKPSSEVKMGISQIVETTIYYKEFHGSFNPFFPALSGTFSFRQHFTAADKKSGH